MTPDEARAIIERMDVRLRASHGEADASFRANIIARTIELRAEVQQIFDDAAYWNERIRKPHELPIQADPDGLLALLLQKLDAQIRSWVQ